jgi:hypothetical protein
LLRFAGEEDLVHIRQPARALDPFNELGQLPQILTAGGLPGSMQTSTKALENDPAFGRHMPPSVSSPTTISTSTMRP